MGIRRRGTRWLVTVEAGVDELGQRQRVFRTVDSESEAKRLYAKLQNEVYEGRNVKPSRESVASFYRRYLADHEHRIAASTHARNTSFTARIDKTLGKVSLAKFTPQAAAKWQQDLLKSGMAPASVNKLVTQIGAALELAVRWHLITVNPIRAITIAQPPVTPFHVYTASEQAALLSAAAPSVGTAPGNVGHSEGTIYVPLVLTLATGMRRGELLGLRTTDYDAANRRLHIRQAARKAKSGQDMGPGKTDRSRRSIVLPESVADLLASYIAKRPRTRSDVLFLSMAGTPYTLSGFSHNWVRVRARGAELMRHDAQKLHDPYWQQAGDGIESGRFHDLRHTHATELLRAGVHVKVVAERLGDSESTVLRVYSHVLPDMQEAAAAAIDPLMRGLLPTRGT